MFSKNLNKVLKEQNITTIALSNATGLSNGYICDLKNGIAKNPSYNTIKKIANALNVKSSDLLD